MCAKAEATAGAKRARLGRGAGLAPGEGEPDEDAEDDMDEGRGCSRKQPKKMFETVPIAGQASDEEVHALARPPHAGKLPDKRLHVVGWYLQPQIDPEVAEKYV
jgi:hypothetical protein